MQKFLLLLFIFVVPYQNLFAKILPGTDLQYVVHQPSIASAHPPVLILLHGFGSNEQDLIGLSAALPQNFLIISVRAPFMIEKNRYKWYDYSFDKGVKKTDELHARQSTNQLELLILKLQKKFGFDAKQIYVGGFSQGAIMSYHIGLASALPIKGIIAMSGKLLPETQIAILKNKVNKDVRIMIVHGTKDAVIEIEEAREAKKLLLLQSIKYTYKEYDIAHSISNQELKDISDWLMQK